ncbi:MAG TPA: FtsQ-type POTRA domain-containing protein [Polyangiaceae bacterium]|nr:FtsQ-type POTRA domain-containing protein [Polyangiaceae bacterium]
MSPVSPPNRRVKTPPRPIDLGAEPLPAPPPPSKRARPPSRVLAALRTTLGIVLVVSAALGVAWAARRHVMTSPRFAVTEIDVVGHDRRTADAIAAESGVTAGANVFSLDLDGARARILADPWISQAALARRLPGTILIQVTERKPAALVALQDTYLATAEGEPFKKLEPGDPIDLPLVTGLRQESLDDDREGTMRTIRRAIDLAAEYDHGSLARRAPLAEVHVDSDGTFAVVVGRSALQLVLGGPPFRRKLDQAARVVAELDRRGAKADSIMLDNDSRPERVVVRMR